MWQYCKCRIRKIDNRNKNMGLLPIQYCRVYTKMVLRIPGGIPLPNSGICISAWVRVYPRYLIYLINRWENIPATSREIPIVQTKSTKQGPSKSLVPTSKEIREPGFRHSFPFIMYCKVFLVSVLWVTCLPLVSTVSAWVLVVPGAYWERLQAKRWLGGPPPLPPPTLLKINRGSICLCWLLRWYRGKSPSPLPPLWLTWAGEKPPSPPPPHRAFYKP